MGLAMDKIWLKSFEEDAENAIHRLLLGIADLGILAPNEPATLLLDWLHDRDKKFAEEVDNAMEKFVKKNWGEDFLPPTKNISVTAMIWSRVGSVAANYSLPLTKNALLKCMRENELYVEILEEQTGRYCHHWVKKAIRV